MNRVAEGLGQLAHFAEGDDKEILAQMSTRFASAAETGDLSSFAPASEPAAPLPPAPPGPPPVDAVASAFSVVDELTGTSSASSSESCRSSPI